MLDGSDRSAEIKSCGNKSIFGKFVKLNVNCQDNNLISCINFPCYEMVLGDLCTHQNYYHVMPQGGHLYMMLNLTFIKVLNLTPNDEIA